MSFEHLVVRVNPILKTCANRNFLRTLATRNTYQRNETRGITINKKTYWILAGIALLLIFADHLFLLIGEALLLSLETLEMAVDTLYEELFHLAPESSQLATAWSGAIVLILLLTWTWKKLRRLYQRMQNTLPGWWAIQKLEFNTWWKPLPVPLKLAHYAGGLALLAILTLSLFV